MPDITPEATIAKIDDAIRAGGNDCAIGRSCGVSRTTVRKRRKAIGVAPLPLGSYRNGAFPAPDAATFALIDERLAAGDYDKVIARTLDVSLYRVRRRRAELGIPFYTPGCNGGKFGANVLTDIDEPLMRSLFDKGETSRAIARAIGISERSVNRRRHRWGYPMADRRFYGNQWTADSGAPACMRPEANPVYAKIKEALSHVRDTTIRDDAAQDMFVDWLAGDLPEEDFARRARRYSGRVISSYANRWGPQSLDETLGVDNEGFTLHALLPDHAAAAAMEVAHMRALASNFGASI